MIKSIIKKYTSSKFFCCFTSHKNLSEPKATAAINSTVKNDAIIRGRSCFIKTMTNKETKTLKDMQPLCISYNVNLYREVMWESESQCKFSLTFYNVGLP